MRNTMRMLGIIGLALGWWGLFGSEQTFAQAGLTATPAQLTVTGTRGATERRTIILRTAEPVSNLRITLTDLTNPTGEIVLPESTMQVEQVAEGMAADGLLRVPVTFHLGTAPSGQFTGEMLVRADRGELVVPVVVTVRDPWYLPLVVLLLGVGLGVIVSVYRARGKPRDEIIVRVATLQQQLNSDKDIAPPFRQRIAAGLEDVGAALWSEQWAEARTAATATEAVWTRWRKWRDDWLTQLRYLHESLTPRLETLEPRDARIVQDLQAKADTLERHAPEMASPAELRAQIELLLQETRRFESLSIRLKALKELHAQLPDPAGEAWRLKLFELQRRLIEVAPGDQQGQELLTTALDENRRQLELAVVQEDVVEKGIPHPRSLNALTQFLDPVPTLTRPNLADQAPQAATRLRWFTFGGYALMVALLALAGFEELYLADPTFGARPSADYFGLLAWGFGAEASRAAITDLVRGWGLPGGK